MPDEDADDGSVVSPKGLDELPGPQGLAAGAVTFVASYVVFFVTVLATARSVDLSTPIRELTSSVGWLFYNAQNVPTRVHGTLGGNATTNNGTTGISRQIDQKQNVLANAEETTVPIEVYFAVPVVVLLLAGLVFMYRNRETITHPLEGVLMTVVFSMGYLLMAMVGTFVFSQQVTVEQSQITQQPAQVDALLYGGLYPLVVVGIAAIVVFVARQQGLLDQA